MVSVYISNKEKMLDCRFRSPRIYAWTPKVMELKYNSKWKLNCCFTKTLVRDWEFWSLSTMEYIPVLFCFTLFPMGVWEGKAGKMHSWDDWWTCLDGMQLSGRPGPHLEQGVDRPFWARKAGPRGSAWPPQRLNWFSRPNNKQLRHTFKALGGSADREEDSRGD